MVSFCEIKMFIQREKKKKKKWYMTGKDVESKRTAQAALTLLVEYCGVHSQDSSVRRELPCR